MLRRRGTKPTGKQREGEGWICVPMQWLGGEGAGRGSVPLISALLLGKSRVLPVIPQAVNEGGHQSVMGGWQGGRRETWQALALSEEMTGE